MKLTTGYKKPIDSNDYVLLAGGGHKSISDFITQSSKTTDLSNYVTLTTAQTISGAKTFSQAINADILGNATTADRLKNDTVGTAGTNWQPCKIEGGVIKYYNTNTTYSNFVKSGTDAASGLVPAPSTTAGTTKYLREDGTWLTPPDNNTWTANSNNVAGYVAATTSPFKVWATATSDGAPAWREGFYLADAETTVNNNKINYIGIRVSDNVAAKVTGNGFYEWWSSLANTGWNNFKIGKLVVNSSDGIIRKNGSSEYTVYDTGNLTASAASGANINTVGTPSVSVTKSGTSLTFTFDYLKGNTGVRGTRISTGTALTGTSTSNTQFSNSGITDSLVGDLYLNTSTNNMYKCTVSGDASTARWAYTCNIKGSDGAASTVAGPAGARGSMWYTGTNLDHTSGTATLNDGISHVLGDMYLNHNTQRVYICTTAGTGGTWTYLCNIKGSSVLSTLNWTEKTDDANYQIALKGTTTSIYYNSGFTYNPNTKTLTSDNIISSLINVDSLTTGNIVNQGTSSLGTVTSGTWNGTTIALANGGTGATTAAGARTNLGLGNAAVRDVCDHDASWNPSTGSGVITEKSLHFALTNLPYTSNTGTVTSITTGTGLTGGTITSTGTISIDNTYQTYISHGELAYNSLSSYVTIAGVETITGAKTFSQAINADILGNATTADRLKNDVAGTTGTGWQTAKIENGVIKYYNSSTASSTITANATDGIFDITGTNGTNAVTYAVAPYASANKAAGRFYEGTTNPTNTDRLNWDGYFYAKKLYSEGSEVLTTSSTITASKLGTATVGANNRPIYINSGTPNAVSYVGDYYLGWGGEVARGTAFSPIDYLCTSTKGNRLAYLDPSGISIEYTTNGTTWNDYESTYMSESSTGLNYAQAKTALVSTQSEFYKNYLGFCIGGGGDYIQGSTQRKATINDKLRINITPYTNGYNTDSTLYVEQPKKLIIYLTTQLPGNAKLDVEFRYKLNSNGSLSEYFKVATYDISGWPAYNTILLSDISATMVNSNGLSCNCYMSLFGGYSTLTVSGTNYNRVSDIRLTFYHSSVSSSSDNSRLRVIGILMIATTCHKALNAMAKTDHMYTYNALKEVEFPGKITSGPEGVWVKSDKNLKTNILKISNSIYKFEWKGLHSGEHYGFIAQELEKEYPSLVNTADSGYKVVNYNDALALVIAKLENKIKQLEQKIKNGLCIND